MKKQDFAEKAKINSATISKMVAGDSVTMEAVEKVYRALDCTFDDVTAIGPDSIIVNRNASKL